MRVKSLEDLKKIEEEAASYREAAKERCGIINCADALALAGYAAKMEEDFLPGRRDMDRMMYGYREWFARLTYFIELCHVNEARAKAYEFMDRVLASR